MKIAKRYMILLVGIIMCISGCRKNSDAIILATDETKGYEDTQQDQEAYKQDNPTDATLHVYVCGAVYQPGVYILSNGARVCDAIEAAQGMTQDACTDYWNQAELLSDGQMIDVPTIEEAQQMSHTTENESQTDWDGRVNINTASKEQLMTIPGVGASRAESILAYRQDAGGFHSIEDVKNVTGIKDGIFQKMKEYITVD